MLIDNPNVNISSITFTGILLSSLTLAQALTAIDNNAVKGPASSTNSDFAMFSGTTGKILKDLGLSLSIDGTFASNSDSLIPSQKAVATYVANNSGGGGGASLSSVFMLMGA